MNRKAVIWIAASIITAACDDTNRVTTLAPTRISTSVNPAFTLAIQPAQLFRRSIAGSACPFRQPFTVPFQLRVSSGSRSTLFLSQVGFHFFDSFGTAAPGITMRQPDLISRFGTVGIPPLGSRIFPFSFELGCATRPTGNLLIIVETIDTTGAATADRRLTLVIN